MDLEKNPPTYCSKLSRQAGEPLFASATPTRLYLLLQYQGGWGAKALEDSSLPEAVKERLKGFSKANREAKVVLIRRGAGQPETATPGANVSPRSDLNRVGIAFYAALADAGHGRLYRFALKNYTELLDYELEAFLSRSRQYEDRRTDEQLALVCTNGRRDACCNKFGTQVYRTLREAVQDESTPSVWQSTHMGGHRFAANLLWLPDGVLYGRVDPHSAGEILASQRSGEIYLPNLRGRTMYPEPAQAADYYLRQRSEEYALEAFQLLEINETGSGQWEVAFQERRSRTVTRIKLAAESLETTVFESCSLDKTTRIKYYRLIE